MPMVPPNILRHDKKPKRQILLKEMQKRTPRKQPTTQNIQTPILQTQNQNKTQTTTKRTQLLYRNNHRKRFRPQNQKTTLHL
jgi:hypothetical protein